jgi:hypothetical protein
MTESHLTPRAEQSMALALERERARLVASLRALDVRTQELGEAQAGEFAAGGAPADVAAELNQHEDGLRLARVERGRGAALNGGQPARVEAAAAGAPAPADAGRAKR